MLRRSILELSHRRVYSRRIPRQITAQPSPSFAYSRKEFSTSPATPQSKNGFPKVVLGSAVIGGAVLVAYRAGYLDQYLGEAPKDSIDSVKNGFEKKDENDIQVVSSHKEELSKLSPKEDFPEQRVSTHADLSPQTETSSDTQGGNQANVEDKSNETLGESMAPKMGKESSEYSKNSLLCTDQVSDAAVLPEGNAKQVDSETTVVGNSEIQDVLLDTKSSGALKEETKTASSPAIKDEASKDAEEPSLAPEEKKIKAMPSLHPISEDIHQDIPSNDIEAPSSLLDTYHLKEKANESYLTSLNRKYEQLSKEPEAHALAVEELNEGYLSKDGKLVFDFLQAIHSAEKRQAELDARAFAKEKQALKEKFEKELWDSRARELRRTEEAAILDKELKRERVRAATAIKSLQEKMEEKLKIELEEKEKEAGRKLQKAEELGKAELAAAIANEKAAQIEKMAEANLHINALCMAFYARSEEARKSHSVHKLALGALALEDALSKGLPIQKEIDALRSYLEGVEKGSVLDLVLSSLPEETRYHGTDTLLDLNQKFNALKGTLRHFSLIPPGGGGILTHSLAHIASWLKVKEVDQSGEGIESVITRVEKYLAEGKLVEAAATLEQGVQGSEAEEIVDDWVKRVRNRAVTEQALTVLQSYATCVSLT